MVVCLRTMVPLLPAPPACGRADRPAPRQRLPGAPCCATAADPIGTRAAAAARACVGALLAALALAGCGGLPVATEPNLSVYTAERFDPDSQFVRRFPLPAAATCEAARRALLSQGYVLAQSAAERVSARKNFQPQRDAHLTLEITVVCVNEAGPTGPSAVFASATQDRYALKKSATQASLGVGPIGSLSVPFGGSDDSLVKVGSETVPAGEFYERFFKLVDFYLDSEVEALPSKADAGAGPAAAADLEKPEGPAATR
jgi:hypothetical protein